MEVQIVKKKETIESGRKFLSEIKEMLTDFKVKATGPKEYLAKNCLSKGGVISTINISNQKSIVNFYRHLCFINPRKEKRLNSTITHIQNKGRIRSKVISDFIKKVKHRIGTDSKLVKEVNRYSLCNYTSRQAEHFRRMESKVPYDFLFSLMKLANDCSPLERLPSYVRFLWEGNY